MCHKNPVMAAGFFAAVCLLMAAVPAVRASSVIIPVTPGDRDQNAFTFGITSKALSDGTIQFRIVVTEKKETFVHPSTDLSTVLLTENTQEIRGIRAVAQEKRSKSIVCVFTVPEKDLADPNFCFVFTNYVEVMQNGKLVQMPAAEFFFARLKDYFKKQP